MTNPDDRRSRSGTPHHQMDPMPQPVFINTDGIPQPIAGVQRARPTHINAEAGPSRVNRDSNSLQEDDPFAMNVDHHPHAAQSRVMH